MGSFQGHALPGSFFFIFGLWCVAQAFRRHFRCRQARQPFYATLTFPPPVCPGKRLRNVPLETIVKILLCGVGLIGELVSGLGHVKYFITNAQHITMYFFFGLTGVLDLLSARGLVPDGSDYAGVMLALLVEAVLFKFHLFGRDRLDVLIHTLLLYVIGLTVLVVGLEAAFRKHSLLPVLRGLLFMVQGTWFWGVAFILYNPLPDAQPWDPDDHTHLMLAVVAFTWHVAVDLLLVMAVGGVTGCCCCYRKRGPQYSALHNTALPDILSEKGEEEEEEESLLGGDRGTVVAAESGMTENGTEMFVRDENLSEL